MPRPSPAGLSPRVVRECRGAPRKGRLTPERRRALELLAGSRHGVYAELLIHGHRISRRVLAGLVGAGLAAAKHEVMKAGGKPIKVVRVRITKAGRQAIRG